MDRYGSLGTDLQLRLILGGYAFKNLEIEVKGRAGHSRIGGQC